MALCFGRDGDDDVTGRNCVTVTRGRVSQNCDSVFFQKRFLTGLILPGAITLWLVSGKTGLYMFQAEMCMLTHCLVFRARNRRI